MAPKTQGKAMDVAIRVSQRLADAATLSQRDLDELRSEDVDLLKEAVGLLSMSHSDSGKIAVFYSEEDVPEGFHEERVHVGIDFTVYYDKEMSG